MCFFCFCFVYTLYFLYTTPNRNIPFPVSDHHHGVVARDGKKDTSSVTATCT